MKYKLHWGWGIGIFYAIFVIIMIAFVLYSASFDRNLVSEDYYEEDLKYQERIDQINRANLLDEKVKIVQNKGTMDFHFPIVNESGISGTIEFFRPSDDNMDKTIDFKLDSGNIYSYDEKDLRRGLWIIKVPWMYNDSSYFYQEEIMIR